MVRKSYDVSSSTLRSWAEQGKVKVVRSQGGPASGCTTSPTSSIESVSKVKKLMLRRLYRRRRTPRSQAPQRHKRSGCTPAPSTEKELLLKWFGTARWTYNKCLEAIKEDRAKLSKKELRALLINNENYVTENQWVLDTPYEVRDAAMIDFLNAYSSNFSKKSKNKNHQFTMR